MAIDDDPLASEWLVHCNRGHPVRELKENERLRQRWNPFVQTECRICGVRIASLKARWRCEYHCSDSICDDCVSRKFQDIAAELSTTSSATGAAMLRQRAEAVPWELRGTKEFNQLRCLIADSIGTELSHAFGLVLKSAVNVPELLGRTKHQGPRASATILAPAAAGVLCGAPGVVVGLAVGTTAYGVSQTAMHVRHPGGRCDPLVLVEVLNAEQETLAAARSHITPKSRNPVWNQTLSLPAGEEGETRHLQQQGWSWRGKRKSAKLAASQNIVPERWDLETTNVRLTLYDKSVGVMDQTIGEVCMPLSSLLAEPEAGGHLVTDSCDEAVLGDIPPYLPCRISLSVVQESLPQSWTLPKCMFMEQFPVHVFMMTRGTRGDVQPFVALARGLAEELGWLVTICTEATHAAFVQKHAEVSRGGIRFRPSGGNSEARMDSVLANFLLSHSTELLQMIALSRSEAEFFSSTTVFMDEVLSSENNKPVDLIIFGFTLAGVAAMVGEHCKKPLIGLILQPSCIPSKQADWKAIHAIQSPDGKSLLDTVEEMAFTSHGSLKVLKDLAEKNPFASMNLNHLRKLFDLEPVANTWQALNEAKVPIIIPMPEGTFQRPQDWSENIVQTEFIFLRKKASAASAGARQDLGETVGCFIDDARRDDAPLCLITFSSMPVPRRTLLRIVLKLIKESKFHVRVMYVGRIEQGPIDLEGEAQKCKDAGTFCEAKAVDFGILFPLMDCFIVHGGLGTTVEALRTGKPTCVTGPLLMDQRFWGHVCYEKGIGPKPVFIAEFEKSCVDFVDGALDPSDPEEWRAEAEANVTKNSWGKVLDDGILANVHCIKELWPSLTPLVTSRSEERKLTSKAWVCCSSAGVSEPEPPMAPLAAKPEESEASYFPQTDPKHSPLPDCSPPTTLSQAVSI